MPTYYGKEEKHESSIPDIVETLYNMLDSFMLKKGVGRFYDEFKLEEIMPRGINRRQKPAWQKLRRPSPILKKRAPRDPGEKSTPKNRGKGRESP